MYMNERAKVNIKVANGKCQAEGKEGRSFQARVVPNDTLQGDSLVEKLVQGDYFGSAAQARNAISNIEEFILAELKKGNRIDFPFASFYPRLSSALSARNVDPEEDGVSVLGAVKATHKLVKALRDSVEAINPAANEPYIRIIAVYNVDADKNDLIRKGEKIEIHVRNIVIDSAHEDECIILEKRSGKRRRQNRFVAKAEIVERSDDGRIYVVFNDDIPCGKYVLVAKTRAGRSTDYALRRIGHPVGVAPLP